LVAGGYVTNSGTVESTAFDGVYFSGAPGRLTNLGTVETTASYQSGVYLDAGGIVVNGSHGKTLGSIDGQWIAAGFASGGTLVNYGTVDSLGTAFGSLGKGGFGVFMPKGGDIYNFGQIEADEFTAVYAGGSAGTPNSGTRGTLHNSGTITSTAEGAVDFAEGGVVFNGKVNKTTALLQAGSNAAAVYMGGSQGTLNSGAAGTVTNFATIETTTTLHSGVELVAGGKVKNIDTYALIEGGLNGVSIGGSGSGSSVISGGVVNYGTIEGTLGAGITLSAGGSVTNSGFVEGYIGVQISGGDATLVDAGTIKGTGSLAVSLTGTGAPLLVVDPGAVFVGTVVGHGSSSTLELANGRQLGTLSGIGSSFQSFGAIKIDPNANWVLSGDASASTLTNDGKILVHDSQTFVFGGVDEDEKAHGKIVLATSGAAEFKAAVASGQSLVFRDATGFLKLDDLSGFAAKMEGFRKGDTIDLANITATSVSFSKGQLAIINSGSTIATLALKGRYTSKEFVVTQVGTDTKITIGAPPPTMPVFVYADPDWHGGGRVFFAERGLLYSGGGGRGELLPFGASASIGAGVADPNPLLPWSADPFHFWTIQG
ncbi:MAG TPA: hypothetical protein VGR70_07340, partial [Stellaceae bacterium]|nr:hypothetical protein [Stellaceae bacterium]